MRRFAIHLTLALLLLAPVTPSAVGGDEECVQLLDLESIGIPAAPGIRPEGREVNDLFLFDGKLWVGCGDATDNTGPTPVYSVDPATGVVSEAFVVDDEGIYTFRTLGGRLAIPGYDAMEPWEWGNLYVLEDGTWTKHRTLPRAIHVVDVCEFGGAWFAAIGASAEFGEEETLALGTVQFSVDAGKTWRTAWSSPADTLSFWRVGSVIPYRGALYAFPYAVGVNRPAAIPEQFRVGIGKPLQGMAYLYRPDPLGAADVVRFDGKAWQPVDLVPTANVCRVRPFVFGDRLLISAAHGEYVGAMSTYVTDERALPPGMTTALYLFDGEKTTRVPLEFDAIRDAVVRDGTLRLLVLARGVWWIAETEDLESFRWLALPCARCTPRSLEHAGGVYWIGTMNGNLLRSIGTRELPSLDAVADHGPRRIAAAGDLPRNARAGWLAVTQLTKPWAEAALSGTIDGGKAHVATTDVDAFRLFPPRAALGEAGALAMEIDGEVVFDGLVPSGRSFLCSRVNGRWAVEVVELTADDYEPQPQVLATCRAPLAPEALAQWAAGALLASEGGDCVLFPLGLFQRELPAGPVTSRAFLDLVYRNRVASFQATGAQIAAMLTFNVQAEPRRRLVPHPHQDGLDPDTTYRVLTTEYVVDHAEEFVGRTLDARVEKQAVHTILLRWLAEHSTIGPDEEGG